MYQGIKIKRRFSKLIRLIKKIKRRFNLLKRRLIFMQ